MKYVDLGRFKPRQVRGPLSSQKLVLGIMTGRSFFSLFHCRLRWAVEDGSAEASVTGRQVTGEPILVMQLGLAWSALDYRSELWEQS